MPALFQHCATAEDILMSKTMQSLPSWSSWVLIIKIEINNISAYGWCPSQMRWKCKFKIQQQSLCMEFDFLLTSYLHGNKRKNHPCSAHGKAFWKQSLTCLLPKHHPVSEATQLYCQSRNQTSRYLCYKTFCLFFIWSFYYSGLHISTKGWN